MGMREYNPRDRGMMGRRAAFAGGVIGGAAGLLGGLPTISAGAIATVCAFGLGLFVYYTYGRSA